MHMAASAPLPTYDAKTNAVLIYSEDVTTVMADGKMKGIERRAYKILRPKDGSMQSRKRTSAMTRRIGSMKAWCIPLQGKDYEVKDKDAVDRSLGLMGGDLITDLKIRTLKFRLAMWET
jgi:hypothetical protein